MRQRGRNCIENLILDMNAKNFKATVKDADQGVELVAKFLSTFDFKFPAKIQISPEGESQSYKALIGIWSREAAEQFTKRSKKGETFSDKEMRELWYHQFIGYKSSKLIGKTRIGEVLGNITDFGNDRGKLFDFARKVENWCEKCGVQLSQPESQYQADKLKQVA